MPKDALKFGFLLLDGFSNMVLASAIEPLRVAQYCAGYDVFEWRLFTLNGELAHSSSALTMQPHGPLTPDQSLDALFVICGYGAQEHATPELLSALRRCAKNIPIMGGLDAGAWILASAGLLDGKSATIHWLDIDAFVEEFANVSVSPKRFVIDGNRITAGGASTVLELMLQTIRENFGDALAFDVSNTFIYDSGRAGITGRGVRNLSLVSREPHLIKAIDQMRKSIADPISLDQIAQVANCSLRSLNRLFLRELGVPPGRYYSMIRITHARALVEETKLRNFEISVRTGFQSSAALSRAFKNHFGKTIATVRNNRFSKIARR